MSREGRKTCADRRGRRTRLPRRAGNRRTSEPAEMGAAHQAASDRRPRDAWEHPLFHGEAGRTPWFTPPEGQEKGLGAGERLTASRRAGPGVGEGLEETWGALHTPRVPLLKASQVSSLPSRRRDGRNTLAVLCHRDHAAPRTPHGKSTQCRRTPSTLAPAQEHARGCARRRLAQRIPPSIPCSPTRGEASFYRGFVRALLFLSLDCRGALGAPTVFQAAF